MDKWDNLDQALNQDRNTVFDVFDHAYGEWSGPNNHPNNFMNYLKDTYSTKYLNLKGTRYLNPEHIEAFLKLKTKEFEPYNNGQAVTKVVDIKEPNINLGPKANRKKYIQYLKNLKNDYQLLESFQLGSKDMNIDFEMDLHQVFTEPRRDEYNRVPVNNSPYNGLFFYTGSVLNENNSKEFIYYMGPHIIKLSKESSLPDVFILVI